ncbi:hypothetical protein [Microbacterium gubbeenense]|uniref:hypothetical protein n=1 Tax=Microbacterium gubbeenense TaxID=159896 RepID=UPI003F980688
MGVAGFVGVEDDAEGFGEDGSDGVVFVDVDLDEEGLVAESAGLVVASGVDAGDVGGEVEAVADVGAGFGVVVVVLGEACVDGVEFGAEFALPGLELVEGDRVREVRVKDAFLVSEILHPPRGEVCSFLAGGCSEPVQLDVQGLTEHGDGLGRDTDALVVVLDEGFDVGGVQGALGAVGGLLVSAGADEVGVDGAAVGAGVVDHQS